MAAKTPCIALVGIDGSGKSTLAEVIGETLKEWGYKTSYFHYNGRTRMVFQKQPRLRSTVVFLDKIYSSIVLRFRRRFVMLDRCLIDAYAYENERAKAKKSKYIAFLEKQHQKVALRPDIILFLKMDVDVAVKRKGGTEYENEQLSRIQDLMIERLDQLVKDKEYKPARTADSYKKPHKNPRYLMYAKSGWVHIRNPGVEICIKKAIQKVVFKFGG